MFQKAAIIVTMAAVARAYTATIPTTKPNNPPNSPRPGLKLSWEPAVAEFIQAQAAAQAEKGNRPYMVGIVGIPGSGKSTGAELLAGLCGGEDSCLCMPFDGYHAPVAMLLADTENADDLIYRRGAPDTFLPELLRRDLQRIRSGNEDEIKLPGFCHARGDPEADAHTFCRKTHNIVVTEGLYLLHDRDGWSDIIDNFDCTVFVDADLDVCMDRLKIRNLDIPGYTPEEVLLRVDAVDRTNAKLVMASKVRADLVVQAASF